MGSWLGKHKRLVTVLAAVGLGLVGLGFWQVYTPDRIAWESVQVGGAAAARATGLVLQEQRGDTAWASRGYAIYRSEEGGPFLKVTTVVPRPGKAWAGFCGGLRDRYGLQELMEVVVLREDLLLTFAGGDIYRIDLAAGTTTRTFTLRYFGQGEGRGVLSRIAVDDRGAVYWGEYCRNKERLPIAVYRSDDEGRTWCTTYEFPAGEITHVHGLQWDPCGRCLWVMTGDLDPECRIGYSLDRGATWHWIGQGSQLWRACSLLFMPDRVVWATDAGEVGHQNYLACWDRRTGEVRRLQELPCQSLYAQQLDDAAGLVALSNRSCSAWVFRAGEPLGQVAEWGVSLRGQAGPRYSPIRGCRLARGRVDGASWLYLNPLRTGDDVANIYRLPREASLRAAAPAPAPQP